MDSDQVRLEIYAWMITVITTEAFYLPTLRFEMAKTSGINDNLYLQCRPLCTAWLVFMKFTLSRTVKFCSKLPKPISTVCSAEKNPSNKNEQTPLGLAGNNGRFQILKYAGNELAN